MFKFDKEFRKDFPDTVGEKDFSFDLSNYCDWLEDQLSKERSLTDKTLNSKWVNTDEITIDEILDSHQALYESQPKFWLNSLHMWSANSDFGSHTSIDRGDYKLVLKIHKPFYINEENFKPTYTIVKRCEAGLGEPLLYKILTDENIKRINSMR